jgi:hypothetical protein
MTENTTMTIRSGLALAVLAVAVAATPALAKHRAHHSGYAAHAQAIDPGDEYTMTPARERALRDCSALGNKLVQKDWGVMQGTTMSACMTEHGQME